ncbi:MAG TPA: hypothetical protein DDX98_01720 [Bacteroidales bacterium]|jgi:transcriptional regulator with XRE-family HTH domain|nr:hypothetical protein [Bacteroidales bacterium]
MEIGTYIKEARLKKGLTQEELAFQTDISVRTIQRIESGEVDPRSYTLQSIAKVLEIDFEHLFNFDKELATQKNDPREKIWIFLLHLSGIFVFIIPPLIIWLWKGAKNPEIKKQGVDVMNFQLSMFIYLICAGLLSLIIIGIPVAIFLGFFSTIMIIINSIKAINRQSYHYPWSIKILKNEAA